MSRRSSCCWIERGEAILDCAMDIIEAAILRGIVLHKNEGAGDIIP